MTVQQTKKTKKERQETSCHVSCRAVVPSAIVCAIKTRTRDCEWQPSRWWNVCTRADIFRWRARYADVRPYLLPLPFSDSRSSVELFKILHRIGTAWAEHCTASCNCLRKQRYFAFEQFKLLSKAIFRLPVNVCAIFIGPTHGKKGTGPGWLPYGRFNALRRDQSTLIEPQWQRPDGNGPISGHNN